MIVQPLPEDIQHRLRLRLSNTISLLNAHLPDLLFNDIQITNDLDGLIRKSNALRRRLRRFEKLSPTMRHTPTPDDPGLLADTVIANIPVGLKISSIPLKQSFCHVSRSRRIILEQHNRRRIVGE